VSKKTLSGARWLLFLNQNFSRIEDFFTDINIPFDCEFLVVNKEHDYHLTLTEVYRVSPSLPLQTRLLRNLASSNNQNLYRHRDNLQGLVLRAVIHESVSEHCGASLDRVPDVCSILLHVYFNLNSIHGTTNYYVLIYNAVTRTCNTITCKLQHHRRHMNTKISHQKLNSEKPVQFSVTNTACF